MAELDHLDKNFIQLDEPSLSLDLSKMSLSEGWIEPLLPALSQALEAMKELEAGSIANADEKRMVGHYWLRNSKLAPTNEISTQIENSITQVEQFAEKILTGEISSKGGNFKNVLIAGIGGSALGPQLLSVTIPILMA
jgi:glucose-6-phosphate isomerase